MINITTTKDSLIITPVPSEIAEEAKGYDSLEEMLEDYKNFWDLLEETRYLGNGYELIDGSFLSRFLNSQCYVIGNTEFAYYLPDSACRDIIYDLLIKQETLTFKLMGEYSQDDDGTYYPIGDIPPLKEVLPLIPREFTHEDFGTWVDLILPTEAHTNKLTECSCFYLEHGSFHYSASSVDRIYEGKPVDFNDPRVLELLTYLTKEFWSDDSDLEYKLINDASERQFKLWQEYRFWNIK